MPRAVEAEVYALARNLWGVAYRRDGVLVMMSRYSARFDASIGVAEHDNLASTWVCGFVATLDAWDQFERDWALALARFNVPFFHMKEFVAHKKPFNEPRWKDNDYRAEFIALLISIIHSNTLCSVRRRLWHANFDFVNEQYDLSSVLNPYALCGLECIQRAHRFVREDYSKSAAIDYVFECGDDGWGLLQKAATMRGFPEPICRPSRVLGCKTEAPPLIVLQATDLAAWEMRREACRVTGIIKGKKLRESFKALKKMECLWEHYLHASLVQFCEKENIGHRVNREAR